MPVTAKVLRIGVLIVVILRYAAPKTNDSLFATLSRYRVTVQKKRSEPQIARMAQMEKEPQIAQMEKE